MADQARNTRPQEGSNRPPQSIPVVIASTTVGGGPHSTSGTSTPFLSSAWLQPSVSALPIQPNLGSASIYSYLPSEPSHLQAVLGNCDQFQIPSSAALYSSVHGWGTAGHFPRPFYGPLPSQYGSLPSASPMEHMYAHPHLQSVASLQLVQVQPSRQGHLQQTSFQDGVGLSLCNYATLAPIPLEQRHPMVQTGRSVPVPPDPNNQVFLVLKELEPQTLMTPPPASGCSTAPSKPRKSKATKVSSKVASACLGEQQDSQAYHLQGVLAQPRIGHNLTSSCQPKDTFLMPLPSTSSTERSVAGSASSGNVQTTNSGFQGDQGKASDNRQPTGVPNSQVFQGPKGLNQVQVQKATRNVGDAQPDIPAMPSVNRAIVEHCQKAKVALIDLCQQEKLCIPGTGIYFAGKRKHTNPGYFKCKIPRIGLEPGPSKVDSKNNQPIASPKKATLNSRRKEKRKMDSAEERLIQKKARTSLDSDKLKPPKHQGTENGLGSQKSGTGYKHTKKTSYNASSGAKGEKFPPKKKDEPGKSAHMKMVKTNPPGAKEEKKAARAGAAEASRPVPWSNLALHIRKSVQVFYTLGKNEAVSAKKTAIATSSNIASAKLSATMARPLAKPLSNLKPNSLTKPALSSLTKELPTSSTKLKPSSLPKPSLSSLPKSELTSWPRLVPLPWLEPEPASRPKPMKSSRPKPAQSSRPKPVASSLPKPWLSSLSKSVPGSATSLSKPQSQTVQKPVMKPLLNPSISCPHESKPSSSQASGWSVQASVAGKATGFPSRPAGPGGNIWRPSSACTSSLVKSQPPGDDDPSASAPYKGDTFIPWRNPPPDDLEVSEPITEEQRPVREVMKRRVQREREEAAQWTSVGRVKYFVEREKEMNVSDWYGYP